MPVVIVSFPRHPLAHALLGDVADSLAAALALGDGDVLVSQVETTGLTASGSGPVAAWWPVVSIHGSDRGSDLAAAGRAAVEAAVRSWAARTGVELGGVWSEWITP